MESTAQYWKPVWQALEGGYKLELAQAQSNKAPKGRKRDFADAERLARRYVAGELILSFVPSEEQRLWRTMTRTKQQLTRDRVRLQAQLEGFLEEARIKLSSHVSDLLGLGSRLMLQALAEGETSPARIAALATQGLKATQEELQDALSAAVTMNPLQRRVLGLFLERLILLETQMDTLEKERGRSAAATSGFRAATGGGAGSGSRFGAADHRRSGTTGGHVSFCRADGLVDWMLSRQGRKRGSLKEQPVTEREPVHAAHSKPGCQCSRQVEGQRIRDSVSAFGGKDWTLQGNLGSRASAVPHHVEDSPRGRNLRGMRPPHQLAGNPTTDQQTNPRSAPPRIPSATDPLAPDRSYRMNEWLFKGAAGLPVGADHRSNAGP